LIHLENVSKTFKVAQRSSNQKDVLKSFFKKRYREVEALKDVSFDIKEGEIVRIYTVRMEQESRLLPRLCVES
jgi:ABC-2 type transport system ATP-binding protein